jgi:hypothetical protein
VEAVMAMDGGRRLAQSTVALTVHGPAGALDLVVPAEASVDDVAREYAGKAGLQFAPALHSRLGQVLAARSSLADLGIHSGDVLAAGGAVRRHAADHVPDDAEATPPGPFSVTWFAVAVGVAALAGWFGSRVGGLDTDEGRLTVVLLSSPPCSGWCRWGGSVPTGRWRRPPSRRPRPSPSSGRLRRSGCPPSWE